jgi:hypothetical protein
MVKDTGCLSFNRGGRPVLGNGFFSICDRQTAWAGQHSIVLDRRSRVAQPGLNLYGPLRPETRVALDAGDGKELNDKFKAIYSSCALAVNAFDYWHDPATVLGSCFGLTSPLRLSFEAKHPIFDDPDAGKPNIDVELNTADGNLIIEHKFIEPFVRYPKNRPPFYARYFKPENLSIWQDMEAARLFAERINRNQEHYMSLDPEQLIKTALGCRRTFGSNWKFIYLWYEPEERDARGECQVLREELANFQAATRGEIPLTAMSWTELWPQLESRAHVADTPYVEWLRERYFSRL